ncbi:MAG: hypothetical protein RR365_10695 [Bacteroides sp.]
MKQPPKNASAPTPAFTFKEVDIKTYLTTSMMLMGSYTVDQLKKAAEDFYLNIHSFVPQMKEEAPVAACIIEEYAKKKGASVKEIQAKLLAILFAYPTVFYAYLSRLPSKSQMLWMQLVQERAISNTEAKNKYHCSFGTPNSSSFWRNFMPKGIFNLFIVTSTQVYCPRKLAYEYEDYLSIPTKLDTFLARLLLSPAKYTCTPLADLPAEKPLLVFQNEQRIFSELLVLNGLLKQSDIASRIDRPQQLKQKKLLDRINLPEFFDSKDPALTRMRAHITLPAFFYFWPSNTKTINLMEEQLKKIFAGAFFSRTDLYFPILLPQITGLRLTETRSASFYANHLKALTTRIATFNVGSWYNVETLINECRINEVTFRPFDNQQIARMNLHNKLTNVQIHPDNLYRELSLPLFKAIFFLYASFGIVDIAYEDYRPEVHTAPFDTLQYFRLTKLGAYVLDIDKVYTPATPQQTDKSIFVLDEHNLIIRSLEKGHSSEILLDNMAQHIGANRYKLSALSVLNNCRTSQDVQSKIQFFQRFISADCPPIWNEFFRTLKQHCHSLKKMPASNYTVYQVDSANTELQQLIAQDPVLKANTVRAEGYLLLIESEKVTLVIDRLKSFGYLL